MFSAARPAVRPAHLTSLLWAGRGRAATYFNDFLRRHGFQFCPASTCSCTCSLVSFRYGNRESAMQYQLPLMCVLDGRPQRVDDTIVSTWQSAHDAACWSFDKRTRPTAKSKRWMAEHLQMRVQHVTRLLAVRDIKLDEVQAHMWDWLTGWSALAQWAEREKQLIAERASEQLTQAFRGRFAA